MTNLLYQSDIISIKDLTKEQIQLVFKTATAFKLRKPEKFLTDKIIAHCFFEPSTRTRLSFETATLTLGGQCIGFADAENTSTKKGESLHDTLKIISDLADLIVLRHPKAGSARLAAQVSNKPVINAGDGDNQHPTQALLDLFTIQECQTKLAGLEVAFMGDLKHARVVHSLAQLCVLFDIRLYFISMEQLALPDNIFNFLKLNGVKFSYHANIKEVIAKVDILYLTRLQTERLSTEDSVIVENYSKLNISDLKDAKSNLKILHPLPRRSELAVEIDETSFAYYFQQAANGLYVRQALLSLLLNETI